jgi:hypothetical protein
MYYEYWGLRKPPFENVPDTSMYVDSHVSMENAIAETLFAIPFSNWQKKSSVNLRRNNAIKRGRWTCWKHLIKSYLRP